MGKVSEGVYGQGTERVVGARNGRRAALVREAVLGETLLKVALHCGTLLLLLAARTARVHCQREEKMEDLLNYSPSLGLRRSSGSRRGNYI